MGMFYGLNNILLHSFDCVKIVIIFFCIRCIRTKTVFTHMHPPMHIHALQLLFEFNEMLKQTVSEVVATNWQMVCYKLLQVPADGLCFHEEYRALQLITYHKKPAKLPFTFAEVSWSNTYST